MLKRATDNDIDWKLNPWPAQLPLTPQERELLVGQDAAWGIVPEFQR